MRAPRLLAIVVLAAASLAGCGDNIHPAADAMLANDAASDDGTPAICGDGVVTGAEQCDDMLGGACSG